MKLCKLFEYSGSGWKRFAVKKELVKFVAQNDMESYHYSSFADGESRLKRVIDAKNVPALNNKSQCVQVTDEVFPLTLTFVGLKDSTGTSLDLIIEGMWKINNIRGFLDGFALERLKTVYYFEDKELETLSSSNYNSYVTDEITENTYDYYKNQNGLPVSWWKNHLEQWKKFDWLDIIEINSVHYESAEAERAEELRQREKLIAHEEQERQQAKEAELRREAEEHEYEAAKQRIEDNKNFNAIQRECQFEELEQQRKIKQLEYERVQEEHKLNLQTMRAKTEAEIAKIHNDAKQAENIMEESKKVQEHHLKILADLGNAQQEMVQQTELFKESMNAAIAGGMDKLHENIERISSNAAGISSKTMELLGKDSSSQYLAQVFREKSNADNQAIMMRKLELRTRDIGTKKVDALAINSSLHFEFMSNRDGYITILNIGTSGTVWLQSPNAYISPTDAKVERDEKYQIPGSNFLTFEDLQNNNLEYIEVGPVGWEELVAIVSDEPLVDTRLLFRSTHQEPFIPLTGGEYDSFVDKLAELPEDSWSVGVLSFLVE